MSFNDTGPTPLTPYSKTMGSLCRTPLRLPKKAFYHVCALLSLSAVVLFSQFFFFSFEVVWRPPLGGVFQGLAEVSQRLFVFFPVFFLEIRLLWRPFFLPLAHGRFWLPGFGPISRFSLRAFVGISFISLTYSPLRVHVRLDDGF